jgi:glycosyltransferase involved in cell wall biosynthesis
VLTHEHARRLVKRGHRVTLFVGAVRGQPGKDTIDGVEVVRSGGPVTTRLHALQWYRAQRERAHFDVVVEEINTLPYFAPWFAAAPVVLWMHQLAREVWWYEAPRPLAAVGFLLERSYLRLYRNKPALVLSASTRQDLLELGFGADHVEIIPPAIEPSDLATTLSEKENGLLVYVGRITPSKRVDHLVEALARVRDGGIDARLEIVGGGEPSAQEAVERVARGQGIEDYVRFAGYLDEQAKRALLARAALIVMASAREGWGLAITEANSVGTPAVVYDRPGLRDSTIHERTGLLTAPNPHALAAGITRALTEPDLYARLQAGGLEWSREFTWDRASSAFELALLHVAEASGRAVPSGAKP